jgi:hypothetical protein
VNRPLGLGDRLSGWAVFVLTLLVLMVASRGQGNTRDEGYYFEAAPAYSGWYVELGRNLAAGQPGRSFRRDAIQRHFGYNHEHPALMKTLFGLSERLFHQQWKLLGPEAALRLPTQVLAAFMAWAVFLFAARLWSRRAGLVAAALAVFAPRLFFDAQLACFDAPIAALWVLVVYAYHRSLEEPRWGWRAALLMGLALATKHNAFFLPFLLVAHYLWLHRARLARRRLPPVPPVFVWMATLSLLVYFVLWPWLWFDTVARFREYVAFHVHHVYYNMEFLGRNYNKPPFPLSFPYVMTLFTVPVTTLALAGMGAAAMLRSSKNSMLQRSEKNVPGTAPGALIALNAVFPLAILTLTRAPIFGATKHFHAAIPFLALFAGYAVHALSAALGEDRRGRALGLALAVLVVLPAALETRRSHPYGLSHYNLLAGGPRGGASLGLNRQFWGYATRGILPWVNRLGLRNPAIYWHDTNLAQLRMHQREGRLRTDQRDSGMEEPGVEHSDVAMVIHEKHFNKYEYWIWDFYGTAQPARVLDHEGVPIVTVYQRPRQK